MTKLFNIVHQGVMGMRRGLIRPRPAGILIGDEYIVTPEDRGWDDTKSCEWNSCAMREAIADANANYLEALESNWHGFGLGSGNVRDCPMFLRHAYAGGRGVVQLTQGKTYTIRPNADDDGSRSNGLGAIEMLNNTEIRTAPSGSVFPELQMSGDNIVGTNTSMALLKMEAWPGKTLCHNRNVISVDDVTNVLIAYVRIDGNKGSITNANLSDGTFDWSQGGNGGLHGIQLLGATDVQLLHVESRNNVDDGMELDQAGIDGQGDLVNIDVTECWFHNNRRQGCNINRARMNTPAFDNIVFTRCRFSHQGDDGALGGERPGAGVDIESSSDGDRLHGISFYTCEFDNQPGSSWDKGQTGEDVPPSAGRAMAVDVSFGPSTVGWINIHDCSMHDNKGAPLFFNGRKTTEIQHLDIRNNVATDNGEQNAIHFGGSNYTGHYTNAVFYNNDITRYVIEGDIPASGHDVDLWMNGRGTPVSNPGSRATFTVHPTGAP